MGARIGRQRVRVLVSALLLLATLLSSLARGQGTPSVNPLHNTIHGTVVNSVTREPIGHALVFSSDSRFGTFTDDQGHFEFAIPQPADKTSNSNEVYSGGNIVYGGGFPSNFPGALSARKPGFLGLQDPSQMLNQVPVILGKDLTIELVPEALIVGRVVLPGSGAPDGLLVELYRRQIQDGRSHWYHAGQVRARSNGEFRFADLEPGRYKLFTGELPDRDPLTFDSRGPTYGYPPVYFPNATDFQTAAEIRLTPGMTFQAELSPSRQAYYPVKVPVSNPPADEYILVNVSVQGHKGPGFDLGYNDRDHNIDGSLPNGTYVIEAYTQADKSATGSVTLTVKGGPVEGPPMTLLPHSSVRISAKFDFKPDPETAAQDGRQGSLSIRDSQWRRQNLSVMLQSTDDFVERNFPQLRPPANPNDESLVFEDVAPGRYWVRIDSPRGFATAATLGDVDLLRRPLTVGLGANLVIDVTIRDDGAEISGTVDGLGGGQSSGAEEAAGPGVFLGGPVLGQLQPNVYFIPLPDEPGQLRQAMVTPDGKFNLQQVPPGSYRVLAFDRPPTDLEYENREAMRTYEGKGQVVRLAAGQKENLKLQVISASE